MYITGHWNQLAQYSLYLGFTLWLHVNQEKVSGVYQPNYARELSGRVLASTDQNDPDLLL